MASLEKLTVAIGADVRNLQQGLSIAQAQVQSFSARSAASLRAFALGPAGLAGITAAAGGSLAALTRSALESADAVGKASRAAGLSAGPYQEWAQVLSMAGIETEALNGSLAHFSTLIGSAAGGNARAVRSIEAVGLELRDANGELRTQDELVEEAISKIGSFGSAQERAAAASLLFGESIGPKLADFATMGTAAIEEQRSAVEKFSDAQIAAAEQINDRWDQLSQTLSVKLKKSVLDTGEAFRLLWEEARRVNGELNRAYVEFFEGPKAPVRGSGDSGIDPATGARRGGGMLGPAPVFVDPRAAKANEAAAKARAAAVKREQDARAKSAKDTADFLYDLNAKVAEQERDRREETERSAVELADSLEQTERDRLDRQRQLNEDYWRDRTRREADASATAEEANQKFAESLASTFADLATNGEEAFERIKESAIKALAQIALEYAQKRFLGSAGGGGGGGGSFDGKQLGGALSEIGNLFGFAGGGSFRVGGSGGSDSKLVAFRATPGEMVDVRTPGQGGGGVNIVVNNHAPQTTASASRRSDGSIEVLIESVAERSIKKNGRLGQAVSRHTDTRRPPIQGRM